MSKWEIKRVTPEAHKVGPERWRGPARLRRDRYRSRSVILRLRGAVTCTGIAVTGSAMGHMVWGACCMGVVMFVPIVNES